MIIEVKAAFPIEWGAEYYTVEKTVKEKRRTCPCCDDTGKVTIKGEDFKCPKCHGNWRERMVIGETATYSLGKWIADSVIVTRWNGITVKFNQTNDKTGYGNSIDLGEEELKTMVYEKYGNKKKIYNEHKAALQEVKRLNKEEKAGDSGGS